MRKKKLMFLFFLRAVIAGGLLLNACFFTGSLYGAQSGENYVVLPLPKHKGNVSLEEAIFKRKSVRSYKDEPLTLEEVSQLLWSAGGATVDAITGPTRAYPSAGAMYPLTIFLVAGKVDGLASGIYRYNWHDNTIDQVKAGDFRKQLMLASFGQRMVGNAPISIVITAVYSRTTRKYGKRGENRYVPMDVGHAGQNVQLQAEALGLGSVIVGAFTDNAIRMVLGVEDEIPLYIIPVGKK